jgi:dTDP-4-dehydrorhamnose 3,5-epimerase-like enzyme
MIAGVRVDRSEIKRDERGWLTEVLRSSNQLGGAKMAQLYVTVGNPGKTKRKGGTFTIGPCCRQK